jgi:nanoRNase/pAp phosphatase (c-di-AMP/oligoRNAs hydrolase)
LEVGGKIMQYQNAQIEAALNNVQSIHIPVDLAIQGMFDEQVKGLAVNARDNVSEIGNRLALASGTFGVCWSVDGDGVVWMNLRSTDNGIDVSDVAKRYGGGGHRNAAGFKTDLMTIARWLK